MPVGHGAIDNLTRRKADQVGGNRELHLRRRGAELPRNVRQRGQVHVSGERPDRAQASQQSRERESTWTQHEGDGSKNFRSRIFVQAVAVQVGPIRVEPGLGTPHVGTNLLNQSPEPPRVIHLDEMGGLVDGEIVEHE